MYPSWWKNRTLSHFSKPNFDMPWPNCWNPYKVNGDPQLFLFLLVQKNIYSHSPLCTRSLIPVLAEIWFFKNLDRGCRTKGPLPNLGRLTVWITKFRLSNLQKSTVPCTHNECSPFYCLIEKLLSKHKIIKRFLRLVKCGIHVTNVLLCLYLKKCN
jgi:hypothetical protein